MQADFFQFVDLTYITVALVCASSVVQRNLLNSTQSFVNVNTKYGNAAMDGV